MRLSVLLSAIAGLAVAKIAHCQDTTSSTTAVASTSTGSLESTTFQNPGPEYLEAPQPNDKTPNDAAVYHPKGTQFDMTDFYNWRQGIREDNDHNGAFASKWLKVAKGNYTVTGGSDPDHHGSIDVTFWSGSWTLDLRGVTLWVPFTDEYKGPNPVFYVNQAGPTFTILGGTIWLDVGQIWSQARVVGVEPAPDQGFDMSLYTLDIEQGYDAGPWVKAGDTLRAAGTKWAPPAVSCADDSNDNHTVRIDTNWWYMNKDSLKVDGRVVTVALTSRAGLKKGLVVSMPTGVQQSGTLVAEEMSGLIVRSMTTNGGFTFIGHDTSHPPIYSSLYIVNLPTRPGVAPTVNPPTMSQGHVGMFNLCEFPPHCETYPDSKWQYTGNVRDVIDMSVDPELPEAGEEARVVQQAGVGERILSAYDAFA